MRLFTALWPSEDARQHLSAAVDGVRTAHPTTLQDVTAGARGFRFLPPERWHLTLCFHGDDADQEHLSDRLNRRLSRAKAVSAGPRVRLAGAGVFRGVMWIGVEPASTSDTATLGRLVRAAGADPHTFRGHMTVARWSRGKPGGDLTELFSDYVGPWWTADELALVRSETRAGATVYRTLHRVPVTGPQVGGPGRPEQC